MPRRRTASPGRPARLVVLVVAFLVAGCGSTTPGPSSAAPPGSPSPTIELYSPGPSPTPEDPAVVYTRIEGQVQTLRGLTAANVLDPVVLDAKALEAALKAQFSRDNPPALVAATQRVDRALGLIPANASLQDLELQLLSGQVIGFYDPRTKKMSVKSVTGGLGVIEQITFAHEYDHALQDQHFDLTKLGTDAPDQGDRSLARLSLAEGDATILMSDWAQTALTPVQLLQYLQDSNISGQTATLDKFPAARKAQLLFPYTSGVTFVQGLENKGGWEAVNQAYAQPPDSTEQILHPEKYVAHEEPVQVPVPADLGQRLGAGWSVDFQDTFGEFGLRTWLQDVGGLDPTIASAAADGWGGDRVVLVSHGDTFAIAIQTVWDTAADATAFAAAAETTRGKLAGSTALIDPGSTNRVTVFVASDAATISRLAAALGLAG
ncbi:MAG TPA: hypothetical protein VF323_01625 [Candidatus Limnocylindrales bacterium]